jgi:hypothetical protein
MYCYKTSKLLNIPANKVQTEIPNRVGSIITAEDLNDNYLSGLVIDIEKYASYQNNAPHIELPIEFTKG